MLLCALLAMPTYLIAKSDDDSHRDHDRAKALLDAGEIMPLDDIIKAAQKVRPGRVLEVELSYEDEHDGYVYELQLITSDGTVWEIELSATSGALLEAEQED